MIKLIRILEVPIYLLVISMCCFENGANKMGFLLVLISIVRCYVNDITDNTIYGRKKDS